MSDLGSNVRQFSLMKAPRINLSLPIAGVRVLGQFNVYPVFAVVDTPSPSAGLRSLSRYDPTVFEFESPVNANTTVQIRAKVRKNAAYLSSGASMMGQVAHALLPVLELERDDGVKASATMPDINDAFQQLQAAIAIARDGVLKIRLRNDGATAGNLLWASQSVRDTVAGPRCYWADLEKAVA